VYLRSKQGTPLGRWDEREQPGSFFPICHLDLDAPPIESRIPIPQGHFSTPEGPSPIINEQAVSDLKEPRRKGAFWVISVSRAM